MAAVEGREVRTYGNWRRPKSAGIAGLGVVGTVGLLVGLVVMIIVLMTRGLLEAFLALVVVALVVWLLVTKDRHDRNAVERMGARMGWWFARSKGEHLYRSGPLGRVPWGTCQLPGLAGPTRLSEHEDSYGRRFALVFSPAASTYSVVIGTEPDGSALVDPEQVDSWVASWGGWLSLLADEPGIEAAAVTIETAPDSGTRLRSEVSRNIDPFAPPFAQTVLEEAVRTYPAGSSTVRAYISITFGAATRTGGKKRSVEEIGRELGSRLPGLTGGLESTGAGASRPLSGLELCEVIRVAYDPAASTLVDEARASGETPDLRWSDVGPAAHQASWSDYLHDSGRSMTWSMSAAPRGLVQSGILSRLLAPHRDIARKRITLLYRPIDPGRAAALVEADRNAAEFRATSSTRASARDTTAVRAAQATAQEEANGAGLVDFGLVVTATVLADDEAADAAATIDNLSAASRLRLRRVYGSQDSAFAAGLPLGLVLSKHSRIPQQIREGL